MAPRPPTSHVAGLALMLCILPTVGLTSPDGLAMATPALVLVTPSSVTDDGVVELAAWLAAGATIGGLVATVLGPLTNIVPLAPMGSVGLGIALGGGVGGVAHVLFVQVEPAEETESVAVADEADEPPAPTPVDLFDDHPDPVLYVADEGYGPVVRAANAAYEDAVGVAADSVMGAPLRDAVMGGDRTDDVVDAVDDGRALDTVIECQTADGGREFRVRTISAGPTGYVIYTPVDGQ